MIKRKEKICSVCLKPAVLWISNPKTCKPCALKVTVKPISKFSDKKVVENKAYSTLRKVFIENKPLCQANLSVCTKVSTDVHHKAGRGSNTLNIKTWLAVCRKCHQWIELHPIEAKELGLSENRL